MYNLYRVKYIFFFQRFDRETTKVVLPTNFTSHILGSPDGGDFGPPSLVLTVQVVVVTRSDLPRSCFRTFRLVG